jgi:hypothetical protein
MPAAKNQGSPPFLFVASQKMFKLAASFGFPLIENKSKRASVSL